MLVKDPEKVRTLCRETRAQGRRIGLVPTMGFFHEGHLSLMRKAKDSGNYVVTSLFVNPPQFGPEEDLNRYPQDLARDQALAAKEGVDLLFVPDRQQIYPDWYRTYVEVEELGVLLCGVQRPTHFKGVTTIVAKLLNIVEPDFLFLGRKDAQQAIILSRMIEDLNFPCEVVVCPTVREADGLAMSSRNEYLSPAERREARGLYLALSRVCKLVVAGERSTRTVVHEMRQELSRWPLVKPEYVAAVDATNLRPTEKLQGKVLLALAACVGPSRLIDNAVLTVSSEGVRVEL
jgi:pantoate--beta-alanine ligase